MKILHALKISHWLVGDFLMHILHEIKDDVVGVYYYILNIALNSIADDLL